MTASNDNNGILSPPSSQPREMQVEQEQEARQLISPPPEEELRPSRHSIGPSLSLSNFKRKRSVQVPLSYSPQATPNPKPRKQSKQAQSIASPTKSRYHLIESPHASNPNADFVPPSRLRGRMSDESEASTSTRRGRRSATPIVVPPYEPPKEVFTPPREITLTPSPSKPKRASRKSVRKTLGIKLEPPSDMDAILKEPMPPASPTDDPLLLSDSMEPEERPVTLPPMDIVTATPRRPTRRAELEGSLPPSSPPSPYSPVHEQHNQDNDLPISSSPVDGVDYFFPQDLPNVSELQDMSTSDDDDVDMDISLADAKGPIPSFVFPPRGKVHTATNEWSDEESDEELAAIHLRSRGEEVGDGEGEFTGKWRMWQVRTKCDPPSSATKSRMDSWGRPISPYPLELREQRSGSPSPGSNGVEDDVTVHLVRDRTGDDNHATEEHDEQVVGAPSIETQTNVGEEGGDDEQEEAEVRAMSIEPDHHEDRPGEGDSEEEDREEEEVRAMSIEPDVRHDSDSEHDEDDEREEEEVREMSFIEEEESDQGDIIPGSPPSAPQPMSLDPQPTLSSSRPVTPHRTPLPTTIPLTRDLSFLRTAKSPANKSRPSLYKRLSKTPAGNKAADVTDREGHTEPQAANDDIEEEHEDTSRDSQLHYQDVEIELPHDDEESSDEDEDPCLVKITSADPRAAARAAAILKQHDYDCFTKVTAREKRPRYSSYNDAVHPLDSLKKDNRRRTVTAAGITKSLSPARRDKSRRHSFGTVVGDNVFMPGTPVVTLTGLLNEAEQQIGSPAVELGRNKPDALETPLPQHRARASHGKDDASQWEWTKEDWKTLDACFTDERIALADCDLSFDMADVDAVDLDKVVERFLELVDVELEEGLEGPWTRDNIRTRAGAIRKKQKSGKVAPPTPVGTAMRSRLSLASNSAPIFSTPSAPPTRTILDTPSWTPGLTPLPKRYTLPPAIGSEAPFSSIKMPRTKALMAPRYGYLLEEVEKVSRGDTLLTPLESSADEVLDEEIEQDEVENSLEISRDSDDSLEIDDEDASSASTQQPQGLGGRMKGIIFSYLPTLSKTSQPSSKKPTRPRQAGLPLPPPDVLSKQRGPIATPARTAVPRGPAPKDLVTLNHQDLPPETKIPRRKEKPKRLVELKNVQPPVEPEIRRNTTDGGGLRRKGSVKDLVKGFEELERSSSSLSMRNEKVKAKEAARPAWRP
ncbi:hypothetical protein AAF712_012337 [Marasmius tenuissimus]|uniref:Uncharacterized protein n=1 Tax=Marasmius tenuissimus TaxID=585030 RepID=A0ABR2ZJF0_9AGAR